MKRVAWGLGIAMSAAWIAASAPAGAFGGSITPGHIDSTGAFGFGQAFDSQTDASASVQRGIITFLPRNPGGPPVTVPNTNLVDISVDTGGVFGFGCWLIPASDFTVNPDLSASLTFDSSDPAVSPCPGDPIGTTAIGGAAAPPADGTIQGLVGEVKMTMSWTPASPIVSNRSNVNETCGRFASISEGVQSGNTSTVSASVSATVEGFNFFLGQIVDVPVDAQLDNGYGNMQTNAFHLNIRGPSTGQCGQFGAP